MPVKQPIPVYKFGNSRLIEAARIRRGENVEEVIRIRVSFIHSILLRENVTEICYASGFFSGHRGQQTGHAKHLNNFPVFRIKYISVLSYLICVLSLLLTAMPCVPQF